MYELNSVLFECTTQKRLIQLFLSAFDSIKLADSVLVDALFGFVGSASQTKPNYKKDSFNNAVSMVLTDHIGQKKSVASEMVLHSMSTIKKHLEWILSSGCTDAFQCTWVTLVLLYVSDDAKLLVSKYTHPSMATHYFDEYNDRFELFLCGQLKHVKSLKKSCLLRQAKTPFEIVLNEWLYAKKIFMFLQCNPQ